MYPSEDDFTGFRIPEFLLAEGTIAGIVAGLAQGTDDWAIAAGIDRAGIAFIRGHQLLFSRRKRLAIRPRNPAAANNRGAKMGGPYMRL